MTRKMVGAARLPFPSEHLANDGVGAFATPDEWCKIKVDTVTKWRQKMRIRAGTGKNSTPHEAPVCETKPKWFSEHKTAHVPRLPGGDDVATLGNRSNTESGYQIVLPDSAAGLMLQDPLFSGGFREYKIGGKW